MSLAVLSQVFTEARRLMIAGSVVAPGDFRLKKLIPPLEQAGKQAPVFAKIAEAAKAVTDGPEDTSAASLLELTSLVNAVLYTQGETGREGKLEPIETTDLGGTATQTSARMLKPLLEALSSTGSGRLEQVKTAHELGHFRDLRLVKPALGALDDPYPEIAEFIAEKVLPMYGKAILSELRAKYDPKGTKGHPRRLKLMHAIDPVATRDLVKDALEHGSKEVKVVAISCLGAEAEDLAFLIEQASAKSQDVRSVAYQALASIKEPEAENLLHKALTGKDYGLAAYAIQHGKNPNLVEILIKEITSGVDALAKLKDKKQTGLQIQRLMTLVGAFPQGNYPAADALLLDLFAQREELVKLKGDAASGTDLVESVIQEMATGSDAAKRAIVKIHAEVPTDQLGVVFHAARDILSPTELYSTFAPYLTAKVDEKKKTKDPALARRKAIIHAIESDSHYYFWYYDEDQQKARAEYDPRWLDLAVDLKRLNMVHALARPNHAGAQTFAQASFDAAIKKAKSPDDVHNELLLMMRLEHPGMVEAFFAAIGKRGKKSYYYHYWFARLIPRLPKDTIPRLEELIATMSDDEAGYWLDAIQEVRTKA
jgi:hypothetical protein